MRGQFEISVSVDRNTERLLTNFLSDSIVLGQDRGGMETRHTNINKFLKESPRHSTHEFNDTDSKFSHRKMANSRE
jgi:hypothetical protein